MKWKLCLCRGLYGLGFPQNSGYHFGGPYTKDYSILESILGSPYFGKLPFGSGYILGFEFICRVWGSRYRVWRLGFRVGVGTRDNPKPLILTPNP